MAADPKASNPPPPPSADGKRTLEFFNDVALRVTVEFGRSRMSVRDLLKLSQGSIVELEKMSGEPLDIRLNGRLVARGEAVIVNDRFGIRVTEICSPDDIEEEDQEAA